MDWSEKHISFAFTLKADTQLGKEEESGNVSWPRTLIAISQALLHHQIFIKKLPVSVLAQEPWYLANICISVFVVNLPIPTRSK